MNPVDPGDFGDLGDDLARLFAVERAASSDPGGDVRARLRGRVANTLGVPPFGGAGHGDTPGTHPTGERGGQAHGAPKAGPSLPPPAAVGGATGHGLSAWIAGKGAAVAVAFALGGAAGALGHQAAAPSVVRLEPAAPRVVVRVDVGPRATQPSEAAKVDAPSRADEPAPLNAAQAEGTQGGVPHASPGVVRGATSASPLPPSAPEPSSAAASAEASAQPRQRDEGLAAERSSLELARTAVLRGQGAAALAALDEHAARFPHGRLGLEREILYIQALAAAGRRSEARERAARFEAKNPTSFLVPAARAAAGAEPR